MKANISKALKLFRKIEESSKAINEFEELLPDNVMIVLNYNYGFFDSSENWLFVFDDGNSSDTLYFYYITPFSIETVMNAQRLNNEINIEKIGELLHELCVNFPD